MLYSKAIFAWMLRSAGVLRHLVKSYYLRAPARGRAGARRFETPCLAWTAGLEIQKSSGFGEDITLNFMVRVAILVIFSLSVGACSKGAKLFDKIDKAAEPAAPAPKESTLQDMFNSNVDANVTINVNKYIWNATLDVLSFLPVTSIDPFTGLIVTGYGTPPGGSTAYRATVLVQDPALDARSLKLALYTRSGAAVSLETLRLVENAILTRARQMRLVDSKL